MLINTISVDFAITSFQNLGGLVTLALTHEPPWRFWEEGKYNGDDANHGPLMRGFGISEILFEGAQVGLEREFDIPVYK